eukprot:351955-Chlamydomonas_euryale.AAC.27
MDQYEPDRAKVLQRARHASFPLAHWLAAKGAARLFPACALACSMRSTHVLRLRIASCAPQPPPPGGAGAVPGPLRGTGAVPRPLGGTEAVPGRLGGTGAVPGPLRGTGAVPGPLVAEARPRHMYNPSRHNQDGFAEGGRAATGGRQGVGPRPWP